MTHQLDDEERAIYQWQMWVDGIGDPGQQKLKQATVLISRIGGIGGLVAFQLAAAGVGRLILAHAGDIQPSDLNRQLLMTHQGIGTSRVESARRKLMELNPRVQIDTIAENINDNNATPIVSQSDIVVDAAPIFPERFAMNQAAFRLRKPIVECAMFEWSLQLTTMAAGQSACLRCLYPTLPSTWKRQFPVFGAVSGSVACMAAVEVIKLVTGVGQPLFNRLLCMDLHDMSFQTLKIRPRHQCPVCANLPHAAG